MTNRSRQDERRLTVKLLRRFSLFCLLLGLFMLLTGGQMSSLNCQRIVTKEGTCELTRVYLFWKSSQRWQLSDVQSIETINNEQQLRLQTADGTIQLMPHYTSLGRTARTHQQSRVRQMIRFFTDDQESSLTIREDMRIVDVPASIAFILIGIAALLDAQRKASKLNT